MNNHNTMSDRAGAGQRDASHPPVETWIDYHAGDLEPGENQRLQGHLAACRECVDLMLDLEAFAEPTAPPETHLADFEKAAVWRSLKPHLKIKRWPVVATLAASVLFAAFGLSILTEQRRTIAGLETRVSDLSSPQVNAMIRDLSPSSRQRSASGADSTTELPVDSGPITLVLHLAEPVTYPSYELEILNDRGDRAHLFTGFQPSEFDNFFVNLPSGSLAAGEYELVLFGVGGQEKDLLEVYPVRLR